MDAEISSRVNLKADMNIITKKAPTQIPQSKRHLKSQLSAKMSPAGIKSSTVREESKQVVCLEEHMGAEEDT